MPAITASARFPNGVITTIAGTGTKGFTGMAARTKAALNNPYGVSVDTAGNVFIADGNVRIRLLSSNGVINTLAGFAAGYGGDGGAAINATLSFPTGMVSDPSTGDVYIADSGNDVVRHWFPAGLRWAGRQALGSSVLSRRRRPDRGSKIYGANLATNVRSWTGNDFTNGGLTAPTALDGNAVTIGGQPAYLDYISGGQINAQVPSGVGTGQQPLVVTNADGGKATFTVTVNAVKPGLSGAFLPRNRRQTIRGRRGKRRRDLHRTSWRIIGNAFTTRQPGRPDHFLWSRIRTGYAGDFGGASGCVSKRAPHVSDADWRYARHRAVCRPRSRRDRALSNQCIRAYERNGQRPDAGHLHGEWHKRDTNAVHRCAVIAGH